MPSNVLPIEPWLQNVDSVYGAHRAARFNRDYCQEGILTPTDMVVSERVAGGAGMAVDISAGVAWVEGDTNVTEQPIYRQRIDSVETVDVDAADATNDRIDRVVIRIEDDLFDSSTFFRGLAEVIPGTPAATPAAPAEPDSALTIATVLVGANESVINDANITNIRRPLVVQSHVMTSRPDNPRPGDIIYLESSNIGFTGILFAFMYQPGINPATPWIGIGGVSVSLDSDAVVSTDSNVPIDLAGPALTIPWTGTWKIRGGAIMRSTQSGGEPPAGFAVVSDSLDDADAVTRLTINNTSYAGESKVWARQIESGEVLELKYSNDKAGWVAWFAHRSIEVWPIALEDPFN